MHRLWSITFFFFKQKTAYEIASCLVGSEMCIRDRGHVLIVHDTRYSSPHLTEIAVDAITQCKCTPKNFGQQTTPQLHHFVFYLNSEKYNPNQKHFNFDTPQNVIADNLSLIHI
eukprot:TRINITY_DN960_c0_g1_i5.p3 TRINITY_DN960_c0_g1~~TRINITY_DN960_c0_g1_i5.p3  ORF type:complete len:114 (-),score=52.11 TRINITY_DN960_c0_g1_i5:2-343(-)